MASHVANFSAQRNWVRKMKNRRMSPLFSTYITCSSKSSQDVLRSHPGGLSRGKVRSLFSWLHISRVQAGLVHWKFFGLWQILPHLQHAWLLAHPGCSSFFCVEVDVTQAKDVIRGKRVFGEVAASETDGTLINITGICKTLENGSLGASDG